MRIRFHTILIASCLMAGASHLPARGQDTTAILGYRPAQKMHVGRLKNLYEIDSGVYRSAQPSKKDLRALRQAGVMELLNLRRDRNKDSLRAISGSFVFHQVPLKASDIQEGRVMDALRVIRDRKGPILIHCLAGSDRTGLISALYRVVFDYWSKEDAIREMKDGGFGFHKRFKNVPEYIRHLNTDSIRAVLFP